MAGGTFLAGVLLGLSLAAPPGPMNALMAAETARAGWLHGLRVGVGAMLADVLFLVASLLGANVLLATTDVTIGVVGLIGAVLMGYFAYGAFRSARNTAAAAPKVSSFLGAFLIALTNPYQITWWLTSGTVLIATVGVAVVAGLFAGILIWITGFPAVILAGARWRWFPTAVGYASAIVLAVFALYFAWNGVRLVGGFS